jgi:hypothetical protein
MRGWELEAALLLPWIPGGRHAHLRLWPWLPLQCAAALSFIDKGLSRADKEFENPPKSVNNHTTAQCPRHSDRTRRIENVLVPSLSFDVSDCSLGSFLQLRALWLARTATNSLLGWFPSPLFGKERGYIISELVTVEMAGVHSVLHPSSSSSSFAARSGSYDVGIRKACSSSSCSGSTAAVQSNAHFVLICLVKRRESKTVLLLC